MDGNIKIEELEQHLLFHRALADDAESFQRINGYMDILASAESGERLQDPVDESIRSVFSLVLENGIDPWEIDLSEFTRMYERKVAEDSFDMIVAGKLMLMAWRILRMQSESTRTRSEPPVVEEVPEDFDDSFFYEDDMLVVPDIQLRSAYRREPVRPVTMYELIDAFEDAREEMEIQRERERIRAELRARQPKAKFDNKAHEEDDERDVEAVWERISRLGPGPICIEDIYTHDLRENLTVFVSVLHLVRDGRLDVWQESYPRGQIYVEMKADPLTVTNDDSEGRIPQVI
jgi:segregation and condensation protein A